LNFSTAAIRTHRSERRESLRVPGPPGGRLATPLLFPTVTNYEERALREELQELRTMAVNADHLRWITRGGDARRFDGLIREFADEWRALAESVACCLVARLGIPPDGRALSLTSGVDPVWPPSEWLDVLQASDWVIRELAVLSRWARVRGEEIDRADIRQLFERVSQTISMELERFQAWAERVGAPVGEVG
jgi:hypothetical protein